MIFEISPAPMRTLLILAACVLLSGCSYMGSFLICNLSPAEIVVSYRLKKGASSHAYFSDEPSVHELKMDGDDADLGAVLTDAVITVTSAVTIVVPAGKALRTGDELNPHHHDVFDGLAYLLIVQGSDTTRLSGAVLPSLVQDLGDQQEGLVIR
jgi:hypothetical protein